MQAVPNELVDLHSHLVPGVDDGAQTLEDALDAADRLARAGVRRIVATPHLDAGLIIDQERLEARLAAVDEAWGRLVQSVSNKFPELELHRGFEVAITTPDVDLSDERLRLAGTAYALIEWPRLRVPPRTEAVIERIQASGVRPLIAHPERYGIVDFEVVGRWRERGALLQVNHGSLVGRYGRHAQQAAEEFLKRGWASYLASDFHARPHLAPYVLEAREALARAGAGEQFRILAGTNPGRLLSNEEPLPVPPLPDNRSLWGRVKELLGGGALARGRS